MADPPTQYVRRERLLAPLRASRVGVVEAGAGYGKSVLVEQFRRSLGVACAYVPLGPADDDCALLIGSLRRALRLAGLSDVVGAAESSEPEVWMQRLLDALAGHAPQVLLVLDDAHHLRSVEATALVVGLARGLARQHRLLLAARSLAPALQTPSALADAARIDTASLAFRTEEAAQLFRHRTGIDLDEHELAAIIEETHGWATALTLAAASYDPGGSEHGGGPRPGFDPIASPVRDILAAMSDADRRALVQLAHLPLLTTDLIGRVTDDGRAFERFVACGVPLARTALGWWEMPGPVATYLASWAPLEEATVLAAAETYGRDGDPVWAITLMLQAGMGEEAAAYLAKMPPHRVEDLGIGVIVDLVERLPAGAVSSNPGVLLHLARVAETAHQGDVRADALERAALTLIDDDTGTGASFRRELNAERARDLIWDARTRDQSRQLASAVVAEAGPTELVATARALDVLGRLASWFSGHGPQPEAEPLLERSASLARQVGHRTWAAQALVPLAMGYHFALCDYEHALSVLDEALADLPARSRYRAMVQTFRAEALIELARFGEAEACFAEMRGIGQRCREKWILAYASWGEANLASYQGDRARTVEAFLDVERHRDSWYEQQSGIEFLAQAADYLDRVGEHRRASECLEAARQRMAGSEHHVGVYSAAVLARSGDPERAEHAIAELFAGGDLEPQERWPLMLLRAHAALRRNDPSAGPLAAEAFDACLAVGHPHGPLIRERAIAEALLPHAARAGSSAAAALLDRNGRLSLRLLGGFELQRAGRTLEPLPGRLGLAVRAVATAGGRLHAEELIELLWPGVDASAGRNRLRNLLARVRSSAGNVLCREAGVIRLAAGTEVDAWEFERQAQAALAAHSTGDLRRSAIVARSALGLYRGALLPDDRYEPWAEFSRERLRLLYLDLLDLLARAAERDADTDEAARLIQRAIDEQPDDEQRYVQLGRLLAAQGRSGSAIAVARQAQSALEPAQILATPDPQELLDR